LRMRVFLLVERLRWTASPFDNANRAAVRWKSKTTQCFLLAVNYFGSNEDCASIDLWGIEVLESRIDAGGEFSVINAPRSATSSKYCRYPRQAPWRFAQPQRTNLPADR